jgi:hypothetical protein
VTGKAFSQRPINPHEEEASTYKLDLIRLTNAGYFPMTASTLKSYLI